MRMGVCSDKFLVPQDLRNGPYLTLHSTTDGSVLDSKCLLPKSRIHGIKVEEKRNNLVVIFGQKVIRIVSLEENAPISNNSITAATDILGLPDLIWDAHWLYDERNAPLHVAIATAHNVVWCWEWQKGEQQCVAHCEESCILYSATFYGSQLDHLLLASGTVFNQILLWKVKGKKDELGKTHVIKRLTGHEGVIFSITFNRQGTLLSSVSDDRSIRLWKVTNLQTFDLNGHVEQLTVVYGHTARVWDAKLLESCFVSIGEDLMCNVWDYEGNVIKVHKGHTGRNIWSLAVNQGEDLIATGGGDGSLRLWMLSSPNVSSINTATKTICLPPSNKSLHCEIPPLKCEREDYPRFVCLLDQTNLLVMTNEGCLYKYSWSLSTNVVIGKDDSSSASKDELNVKDHWTMLLKDTNYSSYSVLALSPCHTIIAFGNLHGKIKLQDTDFLYPCVELDAYSSKVHNLIWSDQDYSQRQHLFSCGPDGIITWWNIKTCLDRDPVFEVSVLYSFVLPPAKQRWVSAVVVLPNHGKEQSVGEATLTIESCVVVCGDRKGSLHLFHPKSCVPLNEKPIAPTHSLPAIHGKAGVSCLRSHNNAIYSAGRDGVYRQLQISGNRLEVVDTKKVFKGFDWVEKLLFTNRGDLIIAGFHAAFFVLWSVHRNEILWRVKCGGAHRVWDLAMEQSDLAVSGATLSFIKDSTIHIHKIVFPRDIKKALLKPAFHGREATCICYIDSLVGQQGDSYDVFATGSEDTKIKLMLSNRSAGLVSELFTAHGHISSVRTLNVVKRPLTQASPCSVNDQNGCHLLFSGGGRASLKCWRVDLSVLEVNIDGCHSDKAAFCPMVFLGEYSFQFSNHRRRRKKQDLASLSEIRFMSLTSLCASELTNQYPHDQFVDSCQSLYFVMAACSDGFVRIFAFDEEQKKFSLLAQSQYLKRCVLTINHLIFLERQRPMVILFAGNTAGKIHCWDIAALLFNSVEERCNLLSSLSNIPPGAGTSNHADENSTIVDNNEGNAFQRDTVVNHGCKESDIKISVGEKTDKEDDAYILMNEPSKAPNKATVKVFPDDETSHAFFEEQSGHSCIPLVRGFLDPPKHVFQAHQSGINAMSITRTQVPGQYLMVSGGDDSALYAAEFSFVVGNDNVIKIDVTREASRASAHTSSVTGVKTLKNGLIVSSSVDQRIVVWELVSEKQDSSTFSFQQCAVEMVDVADVQDLEVWGERDGKIEAAVCGVGLQTLQLVTDL
ncbi:tRNA (34-2'-O)-methyltransferase regulator WDR6-like isoform X3 [Acropora muricata]|uniref:tRNA (34-2'-O)-methyltransferase regulator WDR6-like isoform X3 n=1 Tax=Acropora muricata TaxID=159855 RepID=UPI0034E41CB9